MIIRLHAAALLFFRSLMFISILINSDIVGVQLLSYYMLPAVFPTFPLFACYLLQTWSWKTQLVHRLLHVQGVLDQFCLL